MRKTIPFLICLCLLTATAWSDSNTSEVLPTLDNNAANTSILNDRLRQTDRRLLSLEGGININSQTTGILEASRGGTGQDSSNWTSGDLVYMSGTGAWSHAAASLLTPWVPSNVQVFTSSGTWTKPAGISNVYVKVSGAGGHGGHGSNTGTAGVSGAGGVGSNGSINLSGQNSGSIIGGSNLMGFGSPDPGTSAPGINGQSYGGGASGGHGNVIGGGGGGGGYSEGMTAVTGNVTVTIGSTNSFAGSTTIQATAGSAGTDSSGASSEAGGTGDPGAVIVYY